MEVSMELILDNLASLLSKIHFFRIFKKDIKSLQNQLHLIQAVKYDVEEWQPEYGEASEWLQKLRDVAYEANDLLDELNTRALQRQMSNRKVQFLAFLLNLDYFKMSNKLKNIRERIDKIAEGLSKVYFRDKLYYKPYETFERRQTRHSVDESNVFGRDDDVNAIIQLLSMNSSSSSKSVSVLPIVGMGGIGKTTVTQLVYNRIKQDYDMSIWVSVCDNFRVRKLIHDILEGARKYVHSVGSEHSQLDVLQSQLQEALLTKRYLLVLDNVWNNDQEEWDKLQYPLSSGSMGSKIIVTTRNESVAILVGTCPPYNLQSLSNDACWKLFKSYAFADRQDEEVHPYLIPIGKEIVKKCNGVPLATRVIGSLLQSQRDEREWLSVQHSEFRYPLNRGIMPALWLSYNHLSAHQRLCFFYCSRLPSNYVLNREKIIQQWVAEGMIPDRSKKMEDVGNEYFNDLLSISFFEGVSTADDGKIEDFKIHSLIHDLAQCVSGPSPGRAFHFSQGFDFSSNIPLEYRRLRVLNLSGCGITRLHKSIGHLISLRYLDISYNSIQNLPKEVCHLVNLQTLDLSGCGDLMELPSRLPSLINLRHLRLDECRSLSRVPANIGKMKNLQTLSVFVVGRTFEESLFQLVHLDLRGDLKIKLLENVGYMIPDMCLEYKQLHSLSLSWGYNEVDKVDRQASRQTTGGNNGDNAEHVLNRLVPNRSLKNLYINEYSGTAFPQWMNKNVLLSLSKLVLVNCRRCENLPTLGDLQCLKVLRMEGMSIVTKIGEEFYGKDGSKKPFPCLEELILQDFPDLRFWESTDSLDEFPCLQRLSIIKCPRLENMPWFPSLQYLYMHDFNASIFLSAKELKSPSSLVIHGSPQLTFIPKVLPLNNPHLTSLTLQNIQIRKCPGLLELPDWIGNLSSLRSLAISECENIKSLPQGFQRLTALQHLSIRDCPDLERRCEKEKGEDWSKISHVPFKHVGPLASHGGASTSSS